MGELTTDPVLVILVFVDIPLASEEGVLSAERVGGRRRGRG